MAFESEFTPISSYLSRFTGIIPGITVQEYTKNSIKISGPRAPNFQEEWILAGGRWNEFLSGGPGFLFSITQEPKLQTLLELIAQGRITGITEISPPYTANEIARSIGIGPSQLMGLPAPPLSQNISTVPNLSTDIQVVNWAIPRPKSGQPVILKYDEDEFRYVIYRTETHHGVIDEMYIYPYNETVQVLTKAVITNGKWQLFGSVEPHKFLFL